MGLRFEIVAEDTTTGARAGLLHTPHGIVETPVFMPVGTVGTVKFFWPTLIISTSVLVMRLSGN